MQLISQSARLGINCVLAEDVIIGENSVLGVGCVLDKGVKLGDDVVLGNYVTLHHSVELGSGTQIGDHTMVYPQAKLGQGAIVGSNSSIGRSPRPAPTSTVKVRADLPGISIGENSIIGCSTVLYSGSVYKNQVFVGDGAMVREECSIGENVVIGCSVTVENKVHIGAFSKVHTGSHIIAHTTIEDRVYIGPMVTTTNDNYMGRTEKSQKQLKGPIISRGARIGGGAIILPGIKVKEETFVGAGALVSKDTTVATVYKGFPARDTRPVPEDELLPNLK